MSSWADLTAELDTWAAAGQKAAFWWRDDDAVAPSPQLDRLLALATTWSVPIALAVVPANAEAPLAGRLRQGTRIAVLQHGFAHRNHALPIEKKSELGPQRPLADVVAELAVGHQRLAELFGDLAMPAVMVPPWNRIAPAIVELLPSLGIIGLSTYGAHPGGPLPPGLCQVNTHVDIIAWRQGGGFAGEAVALELVIGHLRTQRTGADGGGGPTGLLTHHLVQDDAAWAFVAALLERTASHSAACWLDTSSIFGRRSKEAPG